MKVTKIFIFLFLYLIPLACTVNFTSKEQLIERSDSLFEKIGLGTANKEFPEKYFPIEQTERIMSDLKNNCDFQHRKGHFLNEYYSKDKSKISLIYEYYLKCDSIRFILTYKLGSNIELSEFRMESIEKNNIMINDQKKRLKL